jgi:hypothetical protein
VKTFKDFLNMKLNETAGDKPAIRIVVNAMSFVYAQDYSEPGYVPEKDIGDRSDALLNYSEEKEGTFSGSIVIPLSQKGIMELQKQSDGNLGSNGMKDFFSDLGGETVLQKNFLDLRDAEFGGTFRPNIDRLDEYPDGIYESLEGELIDKINNNEYEVANVG